MSWGSLPGGGLSADEIWLTATWPFVREQLPEPPAMVVELGCGAAGGHVAALLDAGYDALGVDPEAPRRPGYRRIALEDHVPDAPDRTAAGQWTRGECFAASGWVTGRCQADGGRRPEPA